MNNYLKKFKKNKENCLNYTTQPKTTKKEEIRKKLFLLSAKYVEVGKNIKPID